MKILGLFDTLDFGKHKGKTVSEVIRIDPDWIGWAIRQDIIALDILALNKLIAGIHFAFFD